MPHITRLGCFSAGCCYGLPTSLPWGVTFTHPLAPGTEALRGQLAALLTGIATLRQEPATVIREAQAGGPGPGFADRHG